MTETACCICMKDYSRENHILKDSMANHGVDSLCQHWFCSICLKTLGTYNEIRCPLCREDIEILTYESDSESD